MSLEEMLDAAEAQARKVMIGTKEELVPLWLMQRADGDTAIVATPWSDSRAKPAVIAAMRVMMRSTDVMAYSFLFEAWFAQVSKAEVGKEYTGPPPSERADRKESVVAVAARKGGHAVSRLWETVRDADGVCVELRRMPDADAVMSVLDALLEQPS